MNLALGVIGAVGGLMLLVGCGDAGGTGDGTAASTAGPVWKSTSTRISVSSFGFWEGSMRYEKSAADLSPAQVAALRDLRFIKTSSGTATDIVGYRLVVEDADGSSAQYRAAQGDFLDSDEGNPNGIRSVSYASLAPFLSTFDCKTAKGGGGNTDPKGGALDPESLPSLASDPGCFNGVFVPYAASTQYLKVPVASAGTLKLAVSDCFERTRLTLLSPAGEPLASSEVETEPACASVEAHVDAAGSYVVELEKSNAGDAAEGTAGDLFIRMSLTP